jgi:hypothetical protein
MMRVAVVLVGLLGVARAGPREDLESPVQATRDTAAAKLRTSFKRTPRSKLTGVVAKIKKPGMTKDKTLKLLEPYHPKSEGAGASGGGETILYRIDEGWLLECAFSTRGDGKVLAVRLVDSIRDVWVEPPKDFTGTWITYLANGQKSHEMRYERGVAK